MVRLQDRQLHWIIALILLAGGIFLFFVGRGEGVKLQDGTIFDGMNNFSDGWMYQNDSETAIANFPVEVTGKKNESVEFRRRIMDMQGEIQYLLFQTDCQPVKVLIEGELIYQSDTGDDRLTSFHVVPILPEYNNRNISIVYESQKGQMLSVSEVYIGTKAKLYGQLFQQDGGYLLLGGLLIVISLCMLLFGIWIPNFRYAKMPLVYGSLEGLIIGSLCILQRDFLAILTGWNYGIRFLNISLTSVLILLHLYILRRNTYKKNWLAAMDFGVIGILVYDISIIVLLLFDLVSISVFYWMSAGIFMGMVMLYTLVAALTLKQQKEKSPIFYGNAILTVAGIVQVVMLLVGRQLPYNYVYLPLGILIYIGILFFAGLRTALQKEPQKEKEMNREENIRKRVMEQLNPNLMFASFHTLQKLIKSGSTNSVRMIYYISLYFKGNLKALEKQGERIPFSEELEHILSYLQLQKLRSAGLQFTLECKVKDFWVLRNCIEPLVENAVKHGIAGKPDGGNVVVRTYMRAEGYAVQIIDDGIGFDIKQLKGQSNTSVRTLLSRLETECGAKTELISHEGKGTVITIIFPMLENDLMEEMDV